MSTPVAKPDKNPGFSGISTKISSIFRSGENTPRGSGTGYPVPAVDSSMKFGSSSGDGDHATGKTLARYWLNHGYSYATIIENESLNYEYRVYEPQIDMRERILLEEIHSYMRDIIIYDSPRKKGTISLDYDEVRKAARHFIGDFPEHRLPVIYYYLKRNLSGYGPVDPLMYDPRIEDISCNGAGTPVFVYHTKFGSIATSVIFSHAELNRYILKLSQKVDRQISIASPLLDAPLPDGSRVQMTYTDVVSTKGSSFTIRRFKKDPMTPMDLIRFGTYSPEVLAFIWLAVEHRKSMIVVGGTASGKTSTMNAISYFIPLTSKIVSLEDTREIQLPHKNWLPTKTRETQSGNLRGDIDLFSLLKASLRQRPEFIIVGEVRGEEAQTLFQAMNTGHTTFSTLHAGSVEESVNRLINPPINVPRSMFGALDLMVVQLLQYRNGQAVRRCKLLTEVSVDKSDVIHTQPLYTWNPQTDLFERVFTRSRVLDSIAYSHGWSTEEAEEQLALRMHTLGLMEKRGITRGEEISSIFHLMRLRGEIPAEEQEGTIDAEP